MMDRKGKLCTTRENREQKHYKVDQQKKVADKTDNVGQKKQIYGGPNRGNKLLLLTCLGIYPRRGCVMSCNLYLDIHNSAIISLTNRKQVFNILISIQSKTILDCCSSL